MKKYHVFLTSIRSGRSRKLMLAAGIVSCLLTSAAAAQSALAPLTCLLAPVRISAIGTDLRSIVTDVPVSRADFVSAGDVLIQLDQALALADRSVAEITVQSVQTRVERSAALVARNIISTDEVEQIRTELALAQASLDLANLRVDRTTIYAPFAGYVSLIGVSEGELTGTDPLLQLIDVTTLKAEMVFVDVAFEDIELGQQITIAIDLVGVEVTGTITVIDPFIDATSNTFSVVAEIPNGDLALPAGATCRLTTG